MDHNFIPTQYQNREEHIGSNQILAPIFFLLVTQTYSSNYLSMSVSVSQIIQPKCHCQSQTHSYGLLVEGGLCRSVKLAVFWYFYEFPLTKNKFIMMEGSLSKWTNVMKGWQYRWFVLDENAGLLSYYTVSDVPIIYQTSQS